MTNAEREFLETMGQRIAAQRKTLGLTQTELGDIFSCSQQTIAQYESGVRKLPVTYLPRLAAALQLTVSEIVGSEGLPASSKRRGPPSKIQQRIERLVELPRAQQKLVLKMLDGILEEAT